MVQQSAKELMASQGLQVNDDEKATTFSLREDVNRRQRRQQQRKSQDRVRSQTTSKRLHQRVSVGRSPAPASASRSRPAVITPKNGKYRPSRVESPAARSHVRNRQRNVDTRSSASYRFKENAPVKLSLLVTTPKETNSAAATSSYLKPLRIIPPQSPKRREQRKARLRTMAPVLYGVRLLILGVGIGAIAGTLLSVLDPATRITSAASQAAPVQRVPQEQASIAPVQPSTLKLSQEMMPLKMAVQQLTAQKAGLLPGVFLVDLDTGAYLDVNATAIFAAASTIKLPIVVAFFQDVDAGKIRLDETMTLQQELIAGGSGDMQYKRPGTQYTALEVVTKMMTISDNTATNMIIARLGGAVALNQRFRSWGLTVTQLRNPLPDLAGTNITSPRDLGNLMALVNQGDFMSLRSRDRLLDIMRHTVTDSLLPRGLGKGATIAHKTGDIGSMVGDVGLVDMPNGKRYIASVMVRRPYNDARAQDLIRQVSRMAYEQFNQPAVREMPATP